MHKVLKMTHSIGIFYRSENPTFEVHIRGDEKNPLFSLLQDINNLQKLFEG